MGIFPESRVDMAWPSAFHAGNHPLLVRNLSILAQKTVPFCQKIFWKLSVFKLSLLDRPIHKPGAPSNFSNERFQIGELDGEMNVK